MAVPYIFAASTSAIPLANLDSNFAYFANAITVSATSNALTLNSNLSASFAKEVYGVDTIQVASTTTYPSLISISQFNTNTYRPAFVQLQRQGASSSATPSNSQIGEIRFQGYDTVGAYAYFGGINVACGTNQSGGAQSQMEFLVASAGAQASTRMMIGGYRGSDVGIGCGAYGNIRLRVEQPSGSFESSYPIQSWAYANYRIMDFFLDGTGAPVFNSDPDSYWNPSVAYIWRFRNTQIMQLSAAGYLSLGGTNTSAVLNVTTDGTNTSKGFGLSLTNAAGGGTTWLLSCGQYAVNNGFFTIKNGTTHWFVMDTNGYITVPGVYALTSASAANVFVNSSGSLYRSTSSLKYKTDVQDAVHGLDEVMQLRPVTYKGINDGDTVFGGLIAEEVDALGLKEFVQYANDGTPDALAYGNMVSLLVKAIQQLKAEIDSLKA